MMFASILTATVISGAATTASTGIIEAVDAAAKAAGNTLNAQFLPGQLSYTGPALVGGRINQGRKLTWQFSFNNQNSYPHSIFLASEKKALYFTAIVKNNRGAVVAGNRNQLGSSGFISFVPKSHEPYFLEVEADSSDNVKSAQIAAIFVEVSGKKNAKTADFTSLVRKLMTSTQENLDMGMDYVSGKNIYALAVSALQLSWTNACFFSSLPKNSVVNIASNGGTVSAEIKDSSGPNPQTWGKADDLGNGNAVMFGDNQADLPNVAAIFKNNTRRDTIYFVGITKSP